MMNAHLVSFACLHLTKYASMIFFYLHFVACDLIALTIDFILILSFDSEGSCLLYFLFMCLCLCLSLRSENSHIAHTVSPYLIHPCFRFFRSEKIVQCSYRKKLKTNNVKWKNKSLV
jgi:hypothetical protein